MNNKIVSIILGVITIVVGLVLEDTILTQAATAGSNANIGSFSGAQSLNDLVPLIYNAAVVMLGVGMMASIAYAVWETHWVNPCPDPDALQCNPFVGIPCWCEADFSDAGNWGGAGPPSSPSGVGIIIHSNTVPREGRVDDGARGGRLA